jgi:hypothetical protein
VTPRPKKAVHQVEEHANTRVHTRFAADPTMLGSRADVLLYDGEVYIRFHLGIRALLVPVVVFSPPLAEMLLQHFHGLC